MSHQQNQTPTVNAIVPRELAGRRLDQILGKLFSDYSRTRLQNWVRQGRVWVDGETCQIRQRLHGGEHLRVEPIQESEIHSQPEALDLDIVYEDADLLVVNKPAGLVVHPGAGNPNGTLLNALLYHCPQLSALPRAGIVHRLDKNTTGLLVVALTLECQTHLTRMISDRQIRREYEAVVHGFPPADGLIDLPIGRHPRQRTRMAVSDETRGKPARTHFQAIRYFQAHSHIALRLETGRTHQIRVHLSHSGYPIVGDPEYSGRRQAVSKLNTASRHAVENFTHQALHAKRLSFSHPMTQCALEFCQPLPKDLRELLDTLAKDSEGGKNARP